MELKLERPLVFFDLETTGLEITRDAIVEISMIKVLPDGTEIEKTRRLNPGRPIPAEATAVHHITDEDVAECPSFRQIAQSLFEFIDGCDIAGFNSNRFDVPMLYEEFYRAGLAWDTSKVKFIDVQTIFHKKEQRTLIAAYKFYCDKNLEEAHSANADTKATLEVLKGQLDRYDDLENSVESLSDYSSQNKNVDLMGRLIYDDLGRVVINFGKHKGRLAEDILRQEPGFFSWVLTSDFPACTKQEFRKIQLNARH